MRADRARTNDHNKRILDVLLVVLPKEQRVAGQLLGEDRRIMPPFGSLVVRWWWYVSD